MSTKSDNIKTTLQATRERRKSQTCHVYEIKVDKARLPASLRLSLAQLFREAKWFWNAALASESFFDFDTSVKEVLVKVGDGYELRPLTLLSSQMKQSLIARMTDAVRALHTRKLKGFKVGALKFKSCVHSLPLKQFGNTYRIVDDRHIKIQNLPGSLFVHGLHQLKDAEIANANSWAKSEVQTSGGLLDGAQVRTCGYTFVVAIRSPPGIARIDSVANFLLSGIERLFRPFSSEIRERLTIYCQCS